MLSDALADLEARVAYLAAGALAAEDLAPGDRAGGGRWVPATAFLEPDGILGELLGPDRTGRFARDRRVAASSFFQGAALRVLGTGVGLWLLTGRFPDVSAARTAYALEVDLPARLALVAEPAPAGPPAPPTTGPLGVPTGGPAVARHLTDPDPARFSARAFAGHLDPLAGAVRGTVRIGEQTLWGNAAAAVAGVVLDLVRTFPPADRLTRLAAARDLLDALPHGLGRLGEWTDVGDGVRRDLFWVRRTCCLWYLEDPERRLCDTCNLLAPDERRARLVGQLARRAAPSGAARDGDG